MEKVSEIKLTLDQSAQYEGAEVVVKYKEMTATLNKLVHQIKLHSTAIIGKKENEKHTIALNDIYYFESIDNKTFICLADETEAKMFEIELKLYEVEEQFDEAGFVRISKYCILNLSRLASVKSLLNGKFEAYLDNGEKVLITRHYAPEFKKRFGL